MHLAHRANWQSQVCAVHFPNGRLELISGERRAQYSMRHILAPSVVLLFIVVSPRALFSVKKKRS